jgi:hypothetical protein
MRTIVLLISSIAMSGCRNECQLAPIVDEHCGGIETNLRHAVDRSRAGEDWAYGLGDLRERGVSTRLFLDFTFCQQTRAADASELAKLSTAFQGASQELGESADPAVRERALASMAELFAKLNRYPSRR